MSTATDAKDASDEDAAPSLLSGEALVDQLRDRLARGESLPAERALAAELAVKRHQVRQALEVLRESGELPPARVGRPAKLSDPRGEDMVQWTNPMEVIELRLVLEPSLARLAALRASPAEIAAITRAATTRPDADYGEADLAFHRAVATAARNRLAADFYALLRRVARDNRLSLQRRGPDCVTTRLRQRDAEHQAIAEAIAARDPDASDAAMRRHLTAVQRAITDRLAPGAGA